jgi:hypothetical protein
VNRDHGTLALEMDWQVNRDHGTLELAMDGDGK